MTDSHEKLRLYSYWRSSSAYRVRIALNIKQIDYECIPINLVKQEQRSESYSEINPNLTVPALKLPNGIILTQSNAIMEYLEETYPIVPILPKSALERAQVRAVVDVVVSDIQPVQNMRVLNRLHPDQSKSEWAKQVITSGFEAIERLIKGTQFCFGNSVSMADIVLVPQVYNAKRYGNEIYADLMST